MFNMNLKDENYIEGPLCSHPLFHFAVFYNGQDDSRTTACNKEGKNELKWQSCNLILLTIRTYPYYYYYFFNIYFFIDNTHIQQKKSTTEHILILEGFLISY